LESAAITGSVSVQRLRPPKSFLEDPAVQRWLRKYGSDSTRRNFAFYLLKYLDWLRDAKGVSLSPSELLKSNLENVYGSGPTEVERKRLHTDWLQEYVSLNGPLGVFSNSYRRTAATAVRSFYRRNDSSLFGDFEVPFNAYEEKLTRQISVAEARRYISILPLRSKAVCICLLQCGMRVTEFLHLRWRELQPGIEKGDNPLKVLLRNDRGREYFTFLGRDGIAAVKLYLEYRKNLVRRGIQSDEYVFINDFGSQEHRTDRPLLKDYVERQVVRAVVAKGLVQRKGGRKWRCEFHPHALRHLFKTECAHAGINPMISEFWMGHDKGIEYVYNHQHELHPEDFVEAYGKVEPYLSVSTPEDWADQQEKLRDLERRLTTLEAVYSERIKIRRK